MLREQKKSLLSSTVADSPEEKREVVNVPLNGQAKVLVEGIREDTGVPKTEALSRILEWFASLDKKFQLAVLNRDAETRGKLTRMAMAEMAGLRWPDDAGGVEDIPRAVQAIEVMLRRIEQIDAAGHRPSAGGLKLRNAALKPQKSPGTRPGDIK